MEYIVKPAPDHILTLKEYATLCGISVTLVRRRIDNGLVGITLWNGIKCIDIHKYPPMGQITRHGRPTSEQKIGRASVKI